MYDHYDKISFYNHIIHRINMKIIEAYDNYYFDYDDSIIHKLYEIAELYNLDILPNINNVFEIDDIKRSFDFFIQDYLHNWTKEGTC